MNTPPTTDSTTNIPLSYESQDSEMNSKNEEITLAKKRFERDLTKNLRGNIIITYDPNLITEKNAEGLIVENTQDKLQELFNTINTPTGQTGQTIYNILKQISFSKAEYSPQKIPRTEILRTIKEFQEAMNSQIMNENLSSEISQQYQAIIEGTISSLDKKTIKKLEEEIQTEFVNVEQMKELEKEYSQKFFTGKELLDQAFYIPDEEEKKKLPKVVEHYSLSLVKDMVKSLGKNHKQNTENSKFISLLTSNKGEIKEYEFNELRSEQIETKITSVTNFLQNISPNINLANQLILEANPNESPENADAFQNYIINLSIAAKGRKISKNVLKHVLREIPANAQTDPQNSINNYEEILNLSLRQVIGNSIGFSNTNPKYKKDITKELDSLFNKLFFPQQKEIQKIKGNYLFEKEHKFERDNFLKYSELRDKENIFETHKKTGFVREDLLDALIYDSNKFQKKVDSLTNRYNNRSSKEGVNISELNDLFNRLQLNLYEQSSSSKFMKALTNFTNNRIINRQIQTQKIAEDDLRSLFKNSYDTKIDSNTKKDETFFNLEKFSEKVTEYLDLTKKQEKAFKNRARRTTQPKGLIQYKNELKEEIRQYDEKIQKEKEELGGQHLLSNFLRYDQKKNKAINDNSKMDLYALRLIAIENGDTKSFSELTKALKINSTSQELNRGFKKAYRKENKPESFTKNVRTTAKKFSDAYLQKCVKNFEKAYALKKEGKKYSRKHI
jgi:hypothetical protein